MVIFDDNFTMLLDLSKVTGSRTVWCQMKGYHIQRCNFQFVNINSSMPLIYCSQLAYFNNPYKFEKMLRCYFELVCMPNVAESLLATGYGVVWHCHGAEVADALRDLTQICDVTHVEREATSLVTVTKCGDFVRRGAGMCETGSYKVFSMVALMKNTFVKIYTSILS